MNPTQPAPRPVQAVLCDIGNVLVTFDLEPALARINHRPELPPGDAMARLVHHRDLMEIGKLQPAGFLAALRAEFAFPGSDAELQAIYEDIFAPNPPLWDLVRGWRARGLRLVLFSNISPIHAEFLARRYPVFAEFDEAIFSFRTGDLKPGDGMFDEAVGRLHLDPATTFYIDDNPANCQTGRRHGFITHEYDHRHHAALLADLHAAGL
jgi:HAD superfamily hydrolase (TIGR01509 family)